MQHAENKEINDVIPDNEIDSCFALWKPKILEAIDHIKKLGTNAQILMPFLTI